MARMLICVSEPPVLDRCPGVLRPFAAADGNLVRLRQPGGRLRSQDLLRLIQLAERYGAPFLQLTSRGNLQIRALPDPLPQAFIDVISDLGMLPSPEHERVRNIVAAPEASLDVLVTELDEGLRERQLLTELPGRWLFVLTDETGQYLDSPYDLAYQRLSATCGMVHVGGRRIDCAPESAVEVLLQLSECFLAARPDRNVWNVEDLPQDSAFFTSDVFKNALPAAPHSVAQWDQTQDELGACNGAPEILVIGVPLGLLNRQQVEVLNEFADHMVLTPDRTIVLREGMPTPPQIQKLRSVGLEPLEGAAFPATLLTACIGAPYCRRTNSPTLELARSAMPLLTSSTPRVHIVGCERACGKPATHHVLITAPESLHDVLPSIGIHD